MLILTILARIKVGMGNIQYKYFSEMWPLKKLFKNLKIESKLQPLFCCGGVTSEIVVAVD